MTANLKPAGNDFVENHKARFVYHYNVPSLQDITAYHLVLKTWHGYLSKYKTSRRKETGEIDFLHGVGFAFHAVEETQQFVECLKLPSCTKKVLKECVTKVGSEWKVWAEEFWQLLFGNDSVLKHRSQIRYIGVKWCVCSMNGEIDYRKTAKNILNAEGLTEELKFLIMCEYCMEDELRKFSLDLLPANFISETNYFDDHIRSYWISYLENVLQHHMLVENHGLRDLVMAMSSNRNARFIKEYFWSRLSVDNQVRMVGDWISYCLSRGGSNRDCAILEKLISTMCLDQQLDLLSKKTDTMIIFFSVYSYSSHCALWAWRNSQDQITLKQFCKVLSELLQENRNAIYALNEIWDTAYDHQRNFAVQNKSNEFIDKFLSRRQYSPLVSQFLCKFLHLLSLDEREELILKKAQNCDIFRCDTRSLNDLLNVCLPLTDDQLAFKKLIIDSLSVRKYYREYIQNLNVLNPKLEFYFSHDAKAAQKFKQKVLEEESKNCDDITLICNIDVWNNLSEFIDKSFENNSPAGLKVKQQFVSTLAVRIKCEHCFHLLCSFDDLVKIVEMVFVNKDLMDVKRLFARSFRKLLRARKKSKFMDRHVHELNQKFKKWCLDDHRKLVSGFEVDTCAWNSTSVKPNPDSFSPRSILLKYFRRKIFYGAFG